jgi:WhiB family transcriptional regulator, redox-sensing transcriptional regulator
MADVRRLPTAIAENWAWQLAAACREMDVARFYHPPGERNAPREDRIAEAKAICRDCPVSANCLTHALQTREPYGIWGGHSEEERAAMLGLHSLR